jgi:hypothetical protein
MLANGAMSLVLTLIVARTPSIWRSGVAPTSRGVAASLAFVILTIVALALSLAAPGLGYGPLFLLGLTGVVGTALNRMVGRWVVSVRSAAGRG